VGIGLANVRRRLQARFSDQASLMATALPTGGFSARLRMPLVFDRVQPRANPHSSQDYSLRSM
ncbi:MAG: hypothetical protein ABW063_13650, partial [Caulobacter sp.]